MKLTDGEIIDIVNGFKDGSIGNKMEFPSLFAFRLCRNMSKLDSCFSEIQKEMSEFPGYDQKFEDIDPTGDPQNVHFIALYNEQRMKQRDVEIETCPISMLPENISIDQMKVLYFMLDSDQELDNEEEQ